MRSDAVLTARALRGGSRSISPNLRYLTIIGWRNRRVQVFSFPRNCCATAAQTISKMVTGQKKVRQVKTRTHRGLVQTWWRYECQRTVFLEHVYVFISWPVDHRMVDVEIVDQRPNSLEMLSSLHIDIDQVRCGHHWKHTLCKSP